MTHVIAEPCIGTKDASCVDASPVDCIHPMPGEERHDEATILYIDPAECIDCDACVEVCPVDATLAEDDVPAQWEVFKEINRALLRAGARRRGADGRGVHRQEGRVAARARRSDPPDANPRRPAEGPVHSEGLARGAR